MGTGTSRGQSALERYAAGVNAVASRMIFRQRPLEMQVLGIMPAEWTPVDTLAVGRLLAWRLAENHQSELVRAAVAAKLGAEAARQLAGRYPVDGPTILAAGSSPVPEASAVSAFAPLAAGADAGGRGAVADVQTAATGAFASGAPAPEPVQWPVGLEWLHPMARRGNSNSWVIGGSRSATGRPILANDPHLQIEFPSVWSGSAWSPPASMCRASRYGACRSSRSATTRASRGA